MILSWFWLAIGLIHFVTAKKPNEKCEYKDTVDLTNQTHFGNGSYLYQNILIPHEKWTYYDYRLEFRNKSQPADLHVRGCICEAKPRRRCIKLCCDRDHFFNETMPGCQKLPDMTKSPTELQIMKPGVTRLATVNIYDKFIIQVGLPCAKPEKLSEADKFHVLEDGTLLITSELAILDTVSYCITPHRANGSMEYALVVMSCPMKNDATIPLLLNTYAMAISVIFLVPTILVYLCITELRSNLRGKLLICYLLSMATGYAIISYINITQARLALEACSILGFTGYFFFMSAFIWLSVLCFDIWSNFKETNVDFNSKQNIIRFIMYSIYAWGSAGLLTTFVVWAQISDSVTDVYKPGIGIEICWLDTRKWSAALYFYWPNFIILVFNIITFTHLTLRIYRVRSDVRKITNTEKFVRENAVVILRLFLIMGISWIMDILSYCVRDYKQWEFLFIVTDFCNAIQGVLIFVLFVLKPNVLALLKAKFRKTKPTAQRRADLVKETNFSRLTSRTTSTTIASSP